MVKRKIKIVPLLLVALLVCLCFVPASAASDDGFPILRSYLPFSIEWRAMNATQTAYIDYERELVNKFLLGDQRNTFYGDLLDGDRGVLGSVFSSDLTDDGVFEGEFTSTQAVVTYFIRLTRPVIVPLNFDVKPLLSLNFPDSDVVLNWRIAGYEIARNSNLAHTSVTQTCTPFAYSSTTEMTTPNWFNLVMPTDLSPAEGSLGYIITDIRIAVVSNESSFNIGNFKFKTSYISEDGTLDGWASYLDQIALMNAYEFTATLPSSVDVDFTDWLTTAIAGFWNFELIEGFSLGGIMTGLTGLIILIAILKHFAGG